VQATLLAVLNLLLSISIIGVCLVADPPERRSLAVGNVHMSTSCSPAMSQEFDEGIAPLHNFWYTRAFNIRSGRSNRPGVCDGLLGCSYDL
jgi:hypothetical protein